MDPLLELELLKSYVATLQTCKKCGTCFQNRNHVYHGQVPLCHRCRTHNRYPVVVVKYKSTDNSAPRPITIREEYVIPIDMLNIDMIVSLNALHGATLISSCELDKSETNIRKTFYPDDRGAMFHETFSRETFLGHYNPFHHDLVNMYKYEKEIYGV